MIATTSPFDLAAPLGEALGFDHVLATRYRVRDDRYTGSVEGSFVWGGGKCRAVREWAAENDVDLRESFAYSDSFYDLPLLRAVRHPVVVNPDPRLEVVARCVGWPVRNLDVPEGVPKLVGVEPHRALSAVVRPQSIRFAQFDIDATEHIPRRGPAIVAANHRSYFDPLAIAVALARQGRVGRFMAKQEIFDVPVVGAIRRAMGAIPVIAVRAPIRRSSPQHMRWPRVRSSSFSRREPSRVVRNSSTLSSAAGEVLPCLHA